jgi:hypothetical protein
MNNKGQVLITFLILVPALTLIATYVYKSSATSLYYNQVQTSIDHKALEILSTQAQGLEALGKINPIAKEIIDARRAVDHMIATSVLAPMYLPHLIKLRETLKQIQRVIESKQSLIQTLTAVAVQNQLAHLVVLRFQSKIQTTYSPLFLKLQIKKQNAYSSEVGAPLELTSDFNQKQNILIQTQMKTEKFLIQQKDTKSFDNISLQSFAKIEMLELEGSWQVRLRSPAKVLLN